MNCKKEPYCCQTHCNVIPDDESAVQWWYSCQNMMRLWFKARKWPPEQLWRNTSWRSIKCELCCENTNAHPYKVGLWKMSLSGIWKMTWQVVMLLWEGGHPSILFVLFCRNDILSILRSLLNKMFIQNVADDQLLHDDQLQVIIYNQVVRVTRPNLEIWLWR